MADPVRYKIQNWSVEFEECFNSYTSDQISDIVEKIKVKYADFDGMMMRKYEDMRWTFSESDKSKLYAIPCDAYVAFKHLVIQENRIVFVGILHARGKCNRWYYQSIGKLNVPI